MKLFLSLLAFSLVAPVFAADQPAQTDVFLRGTDGYHTYRIPAVVRTKKGKLLAFIEGRKTSGKDHGDVDLLVKRSSDDGKSREPQQLVHEEGDTAEITIGNPAPVVDRDSGDVWLTFCRDNKAIFVTRSKDDGQTWDAPKPLPITPPGWYWIATGPGHGIQLKNGRLLIPCDCQMHGVGRMYSFALYSDDHGANWKVGSLTGDHMNECQAAERDDGSVILTMRNYHGKGQRAFSISRDGGETWSEPKLNEQVLCPVCEASIVSHPSGRNRLIYSGPADKGRMNLTIRLSDDGGETWPIARILKDGHAEYSDLVVLPNGDVGCLFERDGYRAVSFARFPVEWVLSSAPPAAKP